MKKLAIAIAAIALIGTPAFAADMAVKTPPPAPALVYSWTGFYVGGNVGESWGNDDTTVNFTTPSPTSFTLNFPSPPFTPTTVTGPFSTFITADEATASSGAIGGGQAGYNWQSSNWILGVEADFQASGQKASSTLQNGSQLVGFAFSSSTVSGSGAVNFAQSISHNESLPWFGTVRGRIGYTSSPTFMLYATGGLAYGRLNESFSASSSLTVVTASGPAIPVTATFPSGPVTLPISGSQNFSASVTKTGWTIGGGVEGVVLNTHVTWKAEYLYMDFGSQNYTFGNPLLGTVLVSTHFTDNIFRVGLNYQFH